MSNTKPVPQDKQDIVLATALAGQYLGHQLIYLEAGSGASRTVSHNLISMLSGRIKVPIIVGGGIHNVDDLNTAYSAGADMVVIGTVLEKNPETYPALINLRKGFS
jgi:putative glycerol-1-phosphate prenyltransferase